MNLFAPLAGLLGIEVENLAHRARSMAITYGLIALFGLIGLGFLLVAGFIALSAEVGALYASLIIGAAFLALALAVLLGAQIGESKRRRRVVEKRRSSETGAFLTTAALTALPLLAKSPAILKLGLPAAAIAALAILRDNDAED